MKFSVLGLLLLVPAFGQFQFVQDVAGTIKSAVQTSVHAVENVAKDGIHEVQKLGNQIGSTVQNNFSPPQTQFVPEGPVPGPIPYQPLAVNIDLPKQMKPQISEISKEQRPQRPQRRPSKEHKKPRKQSFSDSDSASDSESDDENSKIQKSKKIIQDANNSMAIKDTTQKWEK